MEEARQRYQRGLELFNEANYEAARVEFERAYQLAPTYKLLYNIGLCYEQLGDYVAAQTTLQQYLTQGADQLTPERRSEVAKELAAIAPRIARLTLRANVTGAELYVDDACATDLTTNAPNCGAMQTDSRQIRLNPGRRRITLKKEGYLPSTQVITVAGSDTMELNMTLNPLPKGYQPKKSNPYVLPMWIGWGVTGAGLITATVTGILAKNAQSDQQNAVNNFGATRASLDDAKSKTHTLAEVTDGFLIGSGVVAAVSTYFTIRAIRWKGESSDVNVKVGLGSASVAGSF